MNTQTEARCEMGMVGLGVMGRNFLLNMAEHGYPVAGYDKDKGKVEALRNEGKEWDAQGSSEVKEFISLLQKPRAIMLLVPAGAPVDSVISELAPLLDAGDLIIDAGNSHFKDTGRRAKELDAKKIQFLGVGVSGGEEGARRGPSIMPGGPKEAYERVRLIFEAAAAHVGQEPCVAYLGPGSAGHFVKMVHNGIEYGIMQLLAESYDLMKRGWGMNNEELSDAFEAWSKGEAGGYLVEITSRIFHRKDDKTGGYLVDEIVGVAKQLGTGMWTSQSAMELQVPTPTIDLAVAVRDLSSLSKEKAEASRLYERPIRHFAGDRAAFIDRLGRALFASMATVYAQGMALLSVASAKYNYSLELETVARIWRGGCIIRSGFLEQMRAAYQSRTDLPNLLLDAKIAGEVMARQEDLRRIVCQSSEAGLPAPAFMVSLAYLDAYRSVWQPGNLIQAQRDYFGSHTYERIDQPGTFHTQWEKE